MFRTLVVAAIVLVVPLAALADLTLVQQVKIDQKSALDPNRSGKTEHVQTVYIKGQKIRIDIKDNSVYTLVDCEKGLFYTVDSKRKTYQKVDMEDLKKLRDVVYYGVMRGLQEIDKKSPEEKAMLEMMHGPVLKKIRQELADKDKPTEVEVTRPEETKIIAGYECSRLVIEENGEKAVEAWVTDEIQTEINLAEVLSAASLFTASVKGEIKKIKSFSLQTTYIYRIAGETVKNSSETIEIEKEEIPAEKFAVPEDYEETESQVTKSVEEYEKWLKEQEEKTKQEEETGETEHPQEQTRPENPEKEAQPEQPEKEDQKEEKPAEPEKPEQEK